MLQPENTVNPMSNMNTPAAGGGLSGIQSPATPSPTQPTAPSEQGPYKPSSSNYSGGAYNMSEYSLVRFGEDPTVWLVDSATKTLRPFENDASMTNFFDSPVSPESILTMEPEAMAEGGIFGGGNGKQGYQILSNDYSIKNDGSARTLDFSNTELQSRYGAPIDEKKEKEMFGALNGVFSLIEGENK